MMPLARKSPLDQPPSCPPGGAPADPAGGTIKININDTWVENQVVTLPVERKRPAGTGGGPPCLVRIHPPGPGLGSRYVLPGSALVVGRGSECDIRTNDPSVSRRHTRIQPGTGGYYAVDLESTNGTYINEVRISACKLQDGDYLYVAGSVFRFLAGDNVETHYHEELHRLTIRDALTGAYNDRFLLEALDRELSRAARYGRPLALVLFDLDRFKAINDELGHLAGDHALREVAVCVRGLLRQADLFARYGGDEFAVVLPETDRAGATATAERLRTRVRQHPFRHEGNDYRVTLSLGVTDSGAGPVPPKEMIRRADAKLYQAKNQGRDQVSA